MKLEGIYLIDCAFMAHSKQINKFARRAQNKNGN